MSIIADQSQTDHSTIETSVGDSPLEQAGQSFTLGANITNIAQIDFWLFKVGSPNGLLSVDIYAASGDSPTGNSLGTSATVDSSTLTANTNGQSVSFSFSSIITGLIPGNKYVAIAKLPNGTDGSNFVRIKGDANGTYSGGTAGDWTTPFNSWNVRIWDMYFISYYDNGITPSSWSVALV